MSLAENKDRCLGMVAAWNRGDVHGVAAYWAPSAAHYDDEGRTVGNDEVLARMRETIRAFPDVHLDVRSILAEGDRVMVRITATATHQGEFMGLAPTGRPVTWHYLEELRFDDRGRVVEHWDVFNLSPLFRELGQVPAGL